MIRIQAVGKTAACCKKKKTDMEKNAMRNDKIENWISELTVEEKVSLCTGKNSWQTQNIERLGIPSITVSDGTNGVRFQKGSKSEKKLTFAEAIQGSFDNEEALAKTYPATCFPTGSAIACSWNKELIQEIGTAIAKECKALGIDVLLGPGINTRRHPLTARNYEYYSEDPCLAGDMAAAIINGVQREGVGTSIKHFACHNSDSYRTRVNVNVSERALREIYLACFERAIRKSTPATVMSAYNKVNGEEASGNSRLVRDILKKEWGYEGTVVCDWGAIKDVAEATKGGIDLQMPHCEMSRIQLLKDVESGKVAMEDLDERVRRVLRLVEWSMEHRQEPEAVDFDTHHALAVEAAAESAVLLKNEGNLLPIDTAKVKKIAVLGRLAKEPVYQGSGCAVVRAVTVDNPLDFIRKECENSGIDLEYADGYKEDGGTDEALLREAEQLYENGYREVCLLGQNVDSYYWEHPDSADRNVDFAGLLEMVAKVSPDLRVRFSTSHPKDISDEVIYTMAMYDNICKHIHLPVQSGSNTMLEKMRRKYTREWYLERVAKIRSVIPDCGLTTDVIAGFCGETEQDHADTLSLMEEVCFDGAFMFQYSERPGTLAARKYKDDVPEDVKTARLNEIIALQGRMSLKSNEKEIGRRHVVLVEGVSKKNSDELFGRASNNKVCVFPSGGHEIGEYVTVEVISCTSATLISRLV